MGSPSSFKQLWSYLGRADKLFLAVLAVYLVARLVGAGGLPHLLIVFALLVTGFVVALKWLRISTRKAIWRLRNRLIVAYLFIAVVPVLLIAILGAGYSYVMAGQVAIYLTNSELDRRLSELDQAALAMVRTPPYQRPRMWDRVEAALAGDFPALSAVIQDRGAVSFSAGPGIEPPPPGWGKVRGVVVKDGVLYSWARALGGDTAVTVMAPITRHFLLSLTPGIGDVTILEALDIPREMQPHGAMPGEQPAPASALPPAKNRFDIVVAQAANIKVALWESPPVMEGGLLATRSRLSAVLDVISSPETSTEDFILALKVLAIAFLIVELVALFIGVSITRTITTAFQSLYEGTERVREGDFSHRIGVRGSDQLAIVSDSFNRMTENLERLLGVAKEKERMQADLEIAQAVQRQLYPKSVPALRGLELLAQCNPARMVSGDYYDYQPLSDGSAVIALGDVAGKGISAALLMATLQSSLRTHVRASIDDAGNNSGGRAVMSTSRLVSLLNEQLYADTSPEKYATFLFSVYNDETGVLTYTNAGHLPPVLFRKGCAMPLDVNGMVVGAFPFAQYTESQLQLDAGDLLLIYSDGITEPENEYGEMFGEERVSEIVLRHLDRDLNEIIQVVMDAVLEWTGSPELQDDMTVLLARRL